MLANSFGSRVDEIRPCCDEGGSYGVGYERFEELGTSIIIY
jgi:hypothetical protein